MQGSCSAWDVYIAQCGSSLNSKWNGCAMVWCSLVCVQVCSSVAYKPRCVAIREDNIASERTAVTFERYTRAYYSKHSA
eukprot:12582-Heterococcus_DN1.PRE.5